MHRCRWSRGAGAAGVAPRVDGVRVELRERGGSVLGVLARRRALIYALLGRGRKVGGWMRRSPDTRGGVQLEVGECYDESGAVRVGGNTRS